ncbi:histidine kinase dimerization/phospho-acceptor domain-containing protein [Sessilibacter sp. MAH2]
MQTEQLSHLRHGIRNKLNTISVSAELIKLLAQKNPDPTQLQKSAERILNECRDCVQLLEASDAIEN